MKGSHQRYFLFSVYHSFFIFISSHLSFFSSTACCHDESLMIYSICFFTDSSCNYHKHCGSRNVCSFILFKMMVLCHHIIQPPLQTCNVIPNFNILIKCLLLFFVKGFYKMSFNKLKKSYNK